ADGAIGAAHRERAMRIIDVALRAFQGMRGQLERLLPHPVAGAIDRRSRHRSRARAPGAVAEWDLIGIALDERDVFDRKAQPIGRDLRERDLVTLAVRMAAGEDRHFAVAVDAYGRALPAAVQAAAFCEIAARPGAGLVDEGGEPDAQQNTVAPQPRL